MEVRNLRWLSAVTGGLVLATGLALSAAPGWAQSNDASEQVRIEAERDSFLNLLKEQREADAAAKRSEAAAQKAAADAAERRRVDEEEASFMRLLADQRKADKEAAQRKAAAKKEAENRAAAAESRRVAEEEASFMRMLAAQRKADEEAAKNKAAAKKEAANRAAAAESRRVAEEEASFMRMLAAQRKADKEAALRKAAAKQMAREKAARSCQERLKQVSATGVIRFALNSAELSDDAGATLLGKLAAAVGSCEGKLSIVVEGHTDSAGSVQFNNRLSQQRAETVAAYLRDKGVAGDRISAKGFGPSKPIASNNTRTGRAQNRRIEFKVQ